MKSFGRTHSGGCEKNEDSIFFECDGIVCVVADGAGRADYGMRAAQALTDELPRALESETMEQALLNLDRYVYQITRPEIESHHWMTCSVVAARLSPDSVEIGHIGNCRAYLFRRDEIVVQTSDHSVRNAIIAKGEPPPDKDSVYTGAITRSVGGEQATPPEIMRWHWDVGDILVLCSYGVHQIVSDDQIAEVLRSGDRLDSMCDRIVDLALADSENNLSVILSRNT